MSSSLLTSNTADRLAKIAGMFGSNHDGERAAAALKFNEALASEGLTAADLLERYCYLEAEIRSLTIDAMTRNMPRGDPGPGGWMRKPPHLRHQSQAAECLDCLSVSDWEREFLQSICRAESLTVRQSACLSRIYSRLGRSA